MTTPDPQTIYFGMLTFVLLLLVLNEWAGHREAQRARARRNNLLHFDPAKTAGGRAGKYQDRASGYTHVGFNDAWVGDWNDPAMDVYDTYQADRELEVPPDAVSER